MRALASLIAFFGLFAAFLPMLVEAQDGKDEPKKTEEKKSDSKKAELKKKPVARVSEAVVLSAPTLKAKVKEVRADEGGTDVKEIVVIGMDEQKYKEYVDWDVKFRRDMPRIINLDEKGKLEYYRRETANRLDGVFSGNLKAINVTPAIRVRTAEAPPQYDAKGVLKKLTPTELAKLKDRSRFPGYPAEIGAIQVGQIVELYVPKSAVQPPKQATPVPPAKKGLIGADPNLAGGAGPTVAKIDAYLIYVLPEIP